jgi:predicted Na+-dependent transporter
MDKCYLAMTALLVAIIGYVVTYHIFNAMSLEQERQQTIYLRNLHD